MGWLSRSSKYLPTIKQELKKAGLPQDLAYLAMELLDGADLLVVGGPTHQFGLSRKSSRRQGADDADGPVISLDLWDRFLVYAIALGVAEVKDWSTDRAGGPRKVVREDVQQ